MYIGRGEQCGSSRLVPSRLSRELGSSSIDRRVQAKLDVISRGSTQRIALGGYETRYSSVARQARAKPRGNNHGLLLVQARRTTANSLYPNNAMCAGQQRFVCKVERLCQHTHENYTYRTVNALFATQQPPECSTIVPV